MTDLYHFILNIILFYKIVIITTLLVILMNRGLFKKTPKWRIGFIVGSGIYILGHLADLTDGASDLMELRYYALARHMGAAVMFTCVFGMHWYLFKRPLFGNTIFAKFMNLDDPDP